MNRFYLSPPADRSYPGLFTSDELERAHAFFRSRADLAPTPLRRLPGLAGDLGLGDLVVKDETGRFGLNAFKIVGVSYAVDRLLAGERARPTLVCATAGNHGRAVARVAAQRGLEARIYVPVHTVPARIHAIAGEGASVVVVDGTYEDAVRRAAADAAGEGWTVVSDTSWPGYDEIPRWIMAGYTWLLEEDGARWSRDGPPDIAVAQAGVGGLACAVASWFCQRYGARRPFLVCCEPERAACALESVKAGRPVTVTGPVDTVMASLRCSEISPVVWPVLSRAFDAFVAVGDEWALEAVRRLARPVGGDPAVVAGPSGACGLAALLALHRDPVLRPVRAAGGLGPRTRALIFATEGNWGQSPLP